MNQKNLSARIYSEVELRNLIPAYPKILDKRIIPALDGFCMEIIKHATLVACASNHPDYPITMLHQNLVKIKDSKTIELDLNRSPEKGNEDIHISLYFLVPGVGHGLRVNGRLNMHREVEVLGAYTHCTRAVARSSLWKRPVREPIQSSEPGQFIRQCPYLLLKTKNKNAQTELSPRGDCAGFVQVIGDRRLFIPERPGNKVAISLRNILECEEAELLMLIPGSNEFLRVRGRASLSKDPALLDATIFNNKRPKLGILVEDCEFMVEFSEAIAKAEPWLQGNQLDEKDLTRFPKVLSAHMNGEGLLGKVTVPIVQSIVKKDLKNLY